MSGSTSSLLLGILTILMFIVLLITLVNNRLKCYLLQSKQDLYILLPETPLLAIKVVKTPQMAVIILKLHRVHSDHIRVYKINKKTYEIDYLGNVKEAIKIITNKK